MLVQQFYYGFTIEIECNSLQYQTYLYNSNVNTKNNTPTYF